MAVAEAHESTSTSGEAVPTLTGLSASSISPARSVAKGALALLSTQPLTWAASIIVVTFLPRLLGDVALGEYTLAFTFPAMLGPVMSLGLLEYLSRSMASRSATAHREASLAWMTMTAVALITACGLAVIVPLLGLRIGSPVVLLAALGMLVITPSQGLLLTLLRGQERMGRFAAITSLSAVASALIPVFVVMVGGGLNGYALASLLVALAALIVSWRTSAVPLPLVRPTLPMLFALLAAGLPFLGWTLAMQFYGQIDRLLIGMLAPIQVTGWYAAAQRIAGVAVFVPTLLVTPLFPALTRCRGDAAAFRHTLNASLRVALLATVPICAAIAAAAPAIPEMLGWPAEFDHAIEPLTIMAPNLSIIALDMVLSTALLALGLERKWLVVGLVAAVVSPGLNLIAIPYTQALFGNGGIGAASVAIVTELVMLAGALLLMPRGLLSISIAFIAARVVAAGAMFVVVTRALLNGGLPPVLAIVLGGILFMVSMVALRLVQLADMQQVVRLVLDLRQSAIRRTHRG